MVTWKDFYVETQRRQAEIDRAQFYNYVRHMDARFIHERFYHRWLASLGAVMENWGRALQARYATLTVAGPSSYQVEESPCSSRC